MSSSAPLESDRELVGHILATVAFAMFVVFLAVVLASSLPLRLLEPAWQLRFTLSLVNNGTLAILGFVLMWLSGVLHPGSTRLRVRRDRVAALAVAAAIGYLLLIPLQGYAAWKAVTSVNSQQGRQLRAASARIESIRQAVQESRSTAELQSKLQTLRGPSLPPADLVRPIEDVRPQILASLQNAEGTLRARLGGLPPDRVLQVVQESVRVVISSLAYAIAFAAGAFLPGQSLSLLHTWTSWLPFQRHRAGRSSTSGVRMSASRAEYLHELSRSGQGAQPSVPSKPSPEERSSRTDQDPER